MHTQMRAVHAPQTVMQSCASCLVQFRHSLCPALCTKCGNECRGRKLMRLFDRSETNATRSIRSSPLPSLPFPRTPKGTRSKRKRNERKKREKKEKTRTRDRSANGEFSRIIEHARGDKIREHGKQDQGDQDNGMLFVGDDRIVMRRIVALDGKKVWTREKINPIRAFDDRSGIEEKRRGGEDSFDLTTGPGFPIVVISREWNKRGWGGRGR